jgi:tetraacyldisaccharide 4'-kinase
LNGVVVSVGNITTGGTGKTPMVIWLAQRFIQNGEKVGILSRGYRPLPQNRAALHNEDMPRFNDEMALIHGRLGANAEYGVDANRFRVGKHLETRGVHRFILDDGFQHLQLARDVNIVMIDGMQPFGGGHVLPTGRLREPLSGLRRADIVVIHRLGERAPAIEAVIRRYTPAPIFYSQAELQDLKLWTRDTQNAVSNGRKFFAFCGIGNPSGFLADLKRWRIEVVGHGSFRDHHWYTTQDLISLETAARKAGADSLICTEKDIYDLPADVATALPLYFCRIGMQFNDEESLWQCIVKRIEGKRKERRG